MEKSSKVFVGMDVHKDSIEVTLAEEGGEVRRLGQIGGDRGSLLKMARRLQSKGGERVFVYEAGPCGFWIHRELAALGERCMVVSPALVPKRAGDHVKTDRRDSERRVRQQLKALLLRNDIRYVGKTSWTEAHRRWLSELKLPQPHTQNSGHSPQRRRSAVHWSALLGIHPPSIGKYHRRFDLSCRD
jgi:transposase